MRIDDLAYQRATRVAAFGLALQAGIGLVLLLFGLFAPDSTFVIASYYALFGVLVWLALVIVFNQHKLERIEALEADELAAHRAAGTGSAFDSSSEEFNVAARRLRLMHKWMMPIVSWVLILLLAGMGTLIFMGLRALRSASDADIAEFQAAVEYRGWALAICLGVAAVSFIFSRFVAGMARQPAWQNLRGGAGYMVGNAVVMLATAAGFIFTYFDNLTAIEIVASAIPIFMMVLAAEFVFNFLLNLYRPRRAGEVPRPAFDSRLLSLLSAPDSIVRSINEAVNYQFGFDISSSWGYQLLLRAAWKLAVFAIIVIVGLNCIVIVEPHQQAVRLRGGEIVKGEIHGPGLMLKWPWPVETAEVHDVASVRMLPLTNQVRENADRRNEPILWIDEIDKAAGIEPFVVSTRLSSPAGRGSRSTGPVAGSAPSEDVASEANDTPADDQARVLASRFALVEAEFVLHYRVRADGEQGLKKFLSFGNNDVERRQSRNARERALKALALREITEYLSAQDLDRIISEDRAEMAEDLRGLIQAAFDAPENDTGVEVLAVTNPWIRPAGEAAQKFEELSYNKAQRERRVAEAERGRTAGLTAVAGSVQQALTLYDMIVVLETMRNEEGAAAQAIAERQLQLEEAMSRAGGLAGDSIASAHSDLWSRVLAAEAQRQRFAGRLAPWRASPSVYREYLLMEAVSSIVTPRTRKYFVGIDPKAMNLSIEMLQDDSAFSFLDSQDLEGTSNEGQ
ncbi:MAG: SPFH domain-containing protein [Phycisphaerales bacterium]